MIIPVYNEAATLRSTVDRVLASQLPLPFEVILVDDGSVDGSAATVADLAASGDIRLTHHRSNAGKGAALRTGIEAARGDVLTVLDADLELDPADFVQMLDPILRGDATVVYGVREFAAHTAFSFWYVLGNKMVNLWASLLFDAWLADVYTCFKMATTETWRALDLRSTGFEVEAEITAKLLRSGHVIYEVPVSYRARSREAGKKMHWVDGPRAMYALLRFRLALASPRSRPRE